MFFNSSSLADIGGFFFRLTMTTITNIVTRATQPITMTAAAVPPATTTVNGTELNVGEAKVEESGVSLIRVVLVIVALVVLAISAPSVNTPLLATCVE